MLSLHHNTKNSDHKKTDIALNLQRKRPKIHDTWQNSWEQSKQENTLGQQSVKKSNRVTKPRATDDDKHTHSKKDVKKESKSESKKTKNTSDAKNKSNESKKTDSQNQSKNNQEQTNQAENTQATQGITEQANTLISNVLILDGELREDITTQDNHDSALNTEHSLEEGELVHKDTTTDTVTTETQDLSQQKQAEQDVLKPTETVKTNTDETTQAKLVQNKVQGTIEQKETKTPIENKDQGTTITVDTETKKDPKQGQANTITAKVQNHTPVREILRQADAVHKQITADVESVPMDDLDTIITKLRSIEERTGLEKQLQKAQLEASGIRRTLEAKMLEKQSLENNALEHVALQTKAKLTGAFKLSTSNDNAPTPNQISPVLINPLSSPTLTRATSLVGDSLSSSLSGGQSGSGDGSGGQGGQQQGKGDQQQSSYTTPKSEGRILLDLSQQKNWQKTLAMRALQVAQNKGEAKLQLHPAELGALIIRVQVLDGTTRIKMIAEKEETARLLTQNKAVLEQTLGEQGMDFKEFDMSQGTASDFSEGDGAPEKQKFADTLNTEKQAQTQEKTNDAPDKTIVKDNRLVDTMV